MNTDDHGLHDSLLQTALDADVPPELHFEFVAAAIAFNRRLSGMAAAARDGVAVAPAYRRPLAAQYASEAFRRRLLGDPTAPAWEACAESADLAEQTASMCR